MKNKHELTRSSMDKLKPIIRKRDGYGCVICGLGIYTYEHFNPEFKDAMIHDINGICLLCFQHQGETSKGILSKETIAQAVQKPACKQRGYTNAFFDLKFPIILHLGNIRFRSDGDRDRDILILGSEVMIKINKLTLNEPIQFYAKFKDKNNRISLLIQSNEWKAPVESWDIEQIGNRLKIINNPLDTRIVLVAKPPHELIFEELDMYQDGLKVHFDNKGKLIQYDKGGKVIRTIYIDSPKQINSLTM